MRPRAGVQFGLQLLSSLAPQRLAHPLAGVLHLQRGHMGVPLSSRQPGMAEHLLDDADMHTLLDQQSRGRVAGIMDPRVADLRLSEDGLPDPPVLGALDRPAATGSEYEIVVRPRAARPQPFRSLLLTVLPQQL